MFSHGTLLINSDLGEVAKALNVKMSKIESKGYKSVRSRVASIIEFLDDREMSLGEFRRLILAGLYRDRDTFDTYRLTESEWSNGHQLKDEKHGSWDWNVGKSPKFNIQRNKRFPIGEIDLRLDVQKGHIRNLKIYGDFSVICRKRSSSHLCMEMTKTKKPVLKILPRFPALLTKSSGNLNFKNFQPCHYPPDVMELCEIVLAMSAFAIITD